MAQVFMDQSTAAQSQPDLLGLPYTTHENVLMRKRNINNTLSVSPELSAHLNSRLSMPPFVFSCSSLRSYENSPSTSSSFANDMASRAGGNEGENTDENSETDDTSLNEQINRNLNDELAATSNSMQSNTRNGCDDSHSRTLSEMTAPVQTSSEVADNQSSTSLPNSEPEGGNLRAESAPSTSTNSDTTVNEVSGDDTNEIREVDDDNNESLDNSSEHNSHTSETVLQENEPITNERNNENDVTEVEDFPAEATVENTNPEGSTNGSVLVSPLESSLLLDNSSPAQPDSTVSVEFAPSSEDSSSSSLQPFSQHEVLTVDLPPEEPDTSFVESDFTAGVLSGPVNDVCEGTSSDILQETNIESSSANQPNTSTENDSRSSSDIETQDSTNASPNTSSLEHLHPQLEIPDENHISQNSVQHTNLTRFGGEINGDSFMDLESEPDIMNVLSLSSATSPDIIMSTQSADTGGTSPRRIVGTCNLRTLFQIPDRENEGESNDNSVGVIQQDDTTPSEDVRENSDNRQVTGTIGNHDNSDIIQPDIETSGNHDSSASNVVTSGLTDGELGAHGHTSDTLPSSSTPVFENSTSSVTEVLDVLPDNGQCQMDQVCTEEATATTNSTEDELTENSQSTSTVDGSLNSQSSCDEPTSQRPTLPSPVSSITHVRHLRSKKVSIRLPSRTASPLPVVHVVPPNVPVSRRNSESDGPSASIEADPILSATRLDSPVQESSLAVARSLVRDVFDAPDGSQEATNVGASTSHSGTSLSEATAGAPTSSVSGTSNSGPKRRSSSGSSQSARNKRKNKSRNRTSRHSSATDPTDDAESLGQSRRRVNDERPNRNHVDNTTEETNDESSPSHRPASIYVQISDFARDEDVLDEPLPPSKYIF